MNAVLDADEGLSAENPGPPGTLLFENEQIRIWELILGPGEYCLWHDHPYDHLLIAYDGAMIEGIYADGERIHLDVDDRQAYYIPKGARTEAARNMSEDRTLRELIVDLKVPALDNNAVAIVNFFRPETPTTATANPTF